MVAARPDEVVAHCETIVEVAPEPAVDAHVDAGTVVGELADLDGAVVEDLGGPSHIVEELDELGGAARGIGVGISNAALLGERVTCGLSPRWSPMRPLPSDQRTLRNITMSSPAA